ncbi:MAG: nucleotidyltransferase [Gemmatimonadota bacterium]
MDFDSIVAMDPGPRRTAALVAWFQGLFEDRSTAPALVGGGAVELYTGGAYVTGDLDFVGYMTDSAAKLLDEVGFRRIGRHWKHEEAQLFIELPGRFLEGGARAVELDAFGNTVRVISPEDVLIDRLAGWKFWKSHEHGVNAFLLYRALDRDLERPRLQERARVEHVQDALEELVRFAEGTKGRHPTDKELREWARRAR